MCRLGMIEYRFMNGILRFEETIFVTSVILIQCGREADISVVNNNNRNRSPITWPQICHLLASCLSVLHLIFISNMQTKIQVESGSYHLQGRIVKCWQFHMVQPNNRHSQRGCTEKLMSSCMSPV